MDSPLVYGATYVTGSSFQSPNLDSGRVSAWFSHIMGSSSSVVIDILILVGLASVVLFLSRKRKLSRK